MDQPIRPKPSNAHKPRVSVVKHRGWTNYLVRVPIFVLRTDDRGQLRPHPAGHVNVGRAFNLADAIRSAAQVEAIWLAESVS